MDNTINIEEIMEEIREKIRMEGPLEDVPGFEDMPLSGVLRVQGINIKSKPGGDMGRISKSIIDAGDYSYIPFYRDMEGKGIKLFVKRVLRKLMAFMMIPALEHISSFNMKTVQCMDQICCQLENEYEEIKKIKQDLEQQKRELDILRSQMTGLPAEYSPESKAVSNADTSETTDTESDTQ